VAQSSSLQSSYELVSDLPRASAATSHGVFVGRWLKSLPRRWARNGAVFGIIYSYAQVGGSRSWEVVLTNGYELHRLIFLLAVTSLGSALIALLLGLWARRALSSVREGEWSSMAKSVLRKWILGANFLGLLMILADVVFEWRGPVLEPGGSAEAIAANIGSLVGLLLCFSVAGLTTGLISRRGLRRAIADDELCASRARA
jgi:hypothetical protein